MLKTKNRKNKIETIVVAENISELEQPIWAAIRSDGCGVCNVPYADALNFSATLLENSATIVTTEAARRFCSKSDCN